MLRLPPCALLLLGGDGLLFHNFSVDDEGDLGNGRHLAAHPHSCCDGVRTAIGLVQLRAGPLAVNLQQQQRAAGHEAAAVGRAAQPVCMSRPLRSVDKRARVGEETAGGPIAGASDRKAIAAVQDVIPVGEANLPEDAELQQLDGVDGAERGVGVNFLSVTAVGHDRQATEPARFALHFAIDRPIVRVEALAGKDQFIAQVEQQMAVSCAAILLAGDERVGASFAHGAKTQPALLGRGQSVHESGVGSRRVVVGQHRAELDVFSRHQIEGGDFGGVVRARGVQMQVAAKVTELREASSIGEGEGDVVRLTGGEFNHLRLRRKFKSLRYLHA